MGGRLDRFGPRPAVLRGVGAAAALYVGIAATAAVFGLATLISALVILGPPLVAAPLYGLGSGWADAGRGSAAALAQLAGAFSGVVLALLPFAMLAAFSAAFLDGGAPGILGAAACFGMVGAWWLVNLVVIALPVAWLTSRSIR